MRYCAVFAQVRIVQLVIAALIVHAGLAARGLCDEESNGISLEVAKQLLSTLKDGEVAKDEKECGITCLYLFLRLHGVDAQLSQLREYVPIGEHGASLRDLASASQKCGLRALPIRCAPSEMGSLQLPAIAHLERSGEGQPYLHYVLLTEVTERGFTLYDPYNCESLRYNNSLRGALFSGYFLVTTLQPAVRPGTVLGTIGLLLAAVGTWQIVIARRRVRPESGAAGTLHLRGLLLLLTCCGCLVGCTREVSEQSSPGDVATKESVGVIEAENTSIDLGQLQWDSVANGELQFRNKSTEPVAVRLGPADCSCMKAELQPEGILAPGESGRVRVYLKTAHLTSAGIARTCVPLVVGDGKEVLRLCVKGFLDGVLFQEKVYVIRPAQQQGGKLPDLRFDVFTYSEKDFEITKITCADIADIPRMMTKDSDRLHTELVDTTSPVTAQLAQAAIFPSQPQTGGTGYVRHVTIPMRLEGPSKAFGGRIILDYILDGKALQAETKMLVVGSDNS